MIPNIALLTQEITDITYPGRTYKINIPHNVLSSGRNALRMTYTTGESESDDRINGYTDGLDAVLQSVYLILSTERYQFIIYSWDYGVELLDLFGKPMPYVMSELPRRITEALTQDDRITDVVDFEFEIKGKELLATFKVVTDIGIIDTELEVSV